MTRAPVASRRRRWPVLALAAILAAAPTAAPAETPLPRPSPLRQMQATANPAAPTPEVGAGAAPAATAAAPVAVRGESAEAVPLPRPKPRPGSGGLLGNLFRGAGAVADLVNGGGGNPDLLADLRDGTFGLETAIRMAADGDIDGATRLAAGLPDRADSLLLEWIVATAGSPALSAARARQAIAKLAGWPGQALMRLRYEQAVIREEPDAAAAIAAFPQDRPTSEPGVMMLTRAYLAEGRRADAAALIQPFWRDRDFSREAEDTILGEFADLLTPADHRARMIRLLYASLNAEALRVAALLDADDRKLAAAFAAVNRRQASAAGALDAVPQSLRGDAAYIFARATYLRRAGRLTDAARLIIAMPAETVITAGGDRWSETRRDMARIFLDRGDAATAYKLVSVNPAKGREEQVALEFQAGWYALRFVKDHDAALRHFQRLKALSPTPLTQSRAEYWLGRTAEAMGNGEAAAAHYGIAASYPTTFYGQLAATRAGVAAIALSAPPEPDAAARERHREHDLVRVVDRLAELDRPGDAAIFARYLAETLTDPADVALLAAGAEARGAYQLGLQIGIIAAARGLPVQSLAFPTAAIPAEAATGTVDRSILYAIARQESRFDPVAVSPAGALGLLQLMPGTAREVAGILGLPYSLSRLTSDPAYNATLGATHFARVLGEWGNSYVLSFAAYNAGSGRVRDWIAAYGDPRSSNVDVIDWIERIPFDETRNYVQRVMENLQVYRLRMGERSLRILADLGRRPSG